ncbi:MAG: hypothetical protein HY270_18455 [Deltaproteobacteria bacterium]|nr:hypothetical protein [Deltaproteobacteria bacterium]
MPVHVEEMTSEVTVLDGDLPMGKAQTEKLVQLVLKRLHDHQREGAKVRESTQLRRSAAPTSPIGD